VGHADRGETQADPEAESEKVYRRKVLALTMRTKVIISGLVYFSSMLLLLAVASPTLLELFVSAAPQTSLWPASSFVLPALRAGGMAPGGDVIALATTCGVEIRSLHDGRLERRLGNDSTYRISWSPDGKRLAVVGDGDLSLSIWDLTSSSQEPVLQLNTRLGPIDADMDWFADSKRIATISRSENSIILWDAEKGRILRKIQSPIGWTVCHSIAISPRLIATAWARKGNASIVLYNSTTYEKISTKFVNTTSDPPGSQVSLSRAITRMAWSPNGSSLAYLVANWPGTRRDWYRLEVWRVEPNPAEESKVVPVKGTPLAWISSFAWSPEGNGIAYIRNMYHTIGLSDLKGRVLGEAEPSEETLGGANQIIGFTPNGKDLVVLMGDQQVVQVFSVPDLSPGLRLDQYSSAGIDSLAISPDGKSIAVLAGQFVRILDIGSGKMQRIFGIRYAPFGGLRYSNDGKKLYVFSTDSMAIWDLDAQEFVARWNLSDELEKIGEGYLYRKSCDLSPDNSMVALLYGWEDSINRLDIVRMNDGRLLRRKDLPPPQNRAEKIGGSIIAWSPDQNEIAFSDYRNVYLWDVSSPSNASLLLPFYSRESPPKSVVKIGSHPNLTALCWHPKLPILLSTGRNDETILWNVTSGNQLVVSKQRLHGPIFSPDGSMILDGIGIYNSSTLQILCKLEEAGKAYGGGWSDTGDTIVIFTAEGSLKVYRLLGRPNRDG